MHFTTAMILAFAASTMAHVPRQDSDENPDVEPPTLCEKFKQSRYESYAYDCCQRVDEDDKGVDCKFGECTTRDPDCGLSNQNLGQRRNSSRKLKSSSSTPAVDCSSGKLTAAERLPTFRLALRRLLSASRSSRLGLSK
jgi:hypothetical protein